MKDYTTQQERTQIVRAFDVKDQDLRIEGDANKKNVEELAEQFQNLAYGVAKLTPPSREKQLALTKIEEAFLWTRESMVRPVGEPVHS